jgi:hypothetical protein
MYSVHPLFLLRNDRKWIFFKMQDGGYNDIKGPSDATPDLTQHTFSLQFKARKGGGGSQQV